VAPVDPYDDTVERFVVFHYRFDPERHERRNVVVAAFTKRRERDKFMKRFGFELRAAIAAGQAEPVESLSGTRWEAGYHAAVAERRRLHPKRLPWRPE
jgi:hypothetical protein